MKQTILYSILLPLALATGCITDGRQTDGDGQARVRFELTMPIPGATRAFTALQEEAINEVDILMFDRLDKFVDWQHGVFDGTLVKATLKGSDPADADDRYRMVVMANSRGRLVELFGSGASPASNPGGDDLGGHAGGTYADVMALITDDVNGVTPSGGIPMWGELATPVRIENGAMLGNISLFRALARLDVVTWPDYTSAVNIDDAWDAALAGSDFSAFDLGNFRLAQVQVRNVQNRFRHSPRTGNYTLTADGGTITAVSLAADAAVTPQSITCNTITASVGVMRGIYLAEADVDMGGTWGDGRHADRPHIIVAGYYKPAGASDFNAALSYYRLDFVSNTATNALHDIFRSHNYQVVIASVTGPGAPTPEAIVKTSSDMVAGIVSWNDVDLSRAIVGTTYTVDIGTAANGTANSSRRVALQDTPVSVLATPAAGYMFTGWTASGVTLVDAMANPVEFTMPAADVTLTPSFAPAVPYTLTVAASVCEPAHASFTASGYRGYASVLGTATSGQVMAGLRVHLTTSSADPTLFEFKRWEVTVGGAVIDQADTDLASFTMPQGNVTVRAVFTRKLYTIYWGPQSTDGAYITVEVGSSPAQVLTPDSPVTGVDPAVGVKVTATNGGNPALTFKSLQWRNNINSATYAYTPNSTLMTPSDVYINAVFESTLFKVTIPSVTGVGVADGTNGATGRSPGVAAGTSVSYTANPGEAYIFTGWTVSGPGASLISPALTSAQLSSRVLSFTMPVGNVTLTPKVSAKARYRLTVNSPVNLTLSPAQPTDGYLDGTSVLITAPAKYSTWPDYFNFGSWTWTMSNVYTHSNTIQITMRANGSVTANYTKYWVPSPAGELYDSASNIYWAGSNLNAADSFAAAAADHGNLFQWANPATVEYGTGPHLPDFSGKTEWTGADDPCPDGWRIPTGTELKNAFQKNSQYTATALPNSSGVSVNGIRFTIGGGTIFFPFTGLRYTDGVMHYTQTYTYIWSSDYYKRMNFSATGYSSYQNPAVRTRALSIRCVRSN